MIQISVNLGLFQAAGETKKAKAWHLKKEFALQVVASIHQPNSQITECFDDLLLLAGGRTAYFGPWQNSMPYFASVGFTCPVYTNPSDHYLLTLKEAGGLMTKIWADSAVAKANLAEGYQSNSCSPGQLLYVK